MADTLDGSPPILIAHRGASGERPEHTIEAYRLAIELGAEFIEPDLVLTKDGVLVARHENEISETTDIATRPEFAGRKTTKAIDGRQVTGWFTEDLTLAELRTLRARERLPMLRTKDYDGQFVIPTFDEVLELAKAESARTGRIIGVYPETKHPAYFVSTGLPHEAPLLAALEQAGYTKKTDPVFIQSFEVSNLKALRGKTGLRLIQLTDGEGGPADLSDVSYRDMASPAGLKAIALYADGIGPAKAMVIPRDGSGRMMGPTTLVTDAHRAGLAVHPWTFRRENFFLDVGHRRGDDLREAGDVAGEISAFLATGIDGLFSDNVREARAAIDTMTQKNRVKEQAP